MKPKSALRSFLLLSGSSLLAISFASAVTWNAGTLDSTDSLWSTAGNWTLDTAPSNGDDLTFDELVNQTNTNDLLTSINSLTLNNAGWSITLGTLSIGGGGIAANGTSTLGGTLTLGALQSWNNSTGLLTVTGTVDNGGNLLTVSGAGDTTISSDITGAGGLTKQDAGILTLSGANGYAGLTTVTLGTLKLGSTSALGTIANETTVASGGALDLNGVTLSTAEALSIIGTGVGSTGALTNSGAAASYSGIVTVGTGGATIGGSGNITLSTALAANANQLNKVGAGKLTLQAASTRTGATVIDGGILRIENITAFGTTAAAITINNGGTLEVGTGTTVANGTGVITLNDGGTISSGLAGTAARIDKTINLQASGTGVFTFDSGSNTSNVLTINGGGNSRLAGGATGAKIQIKGSGEVNVGESGQTRTTAVIADWYLQGGSLRMRADTEIGVAANDLYFEGGTLLTDGAFTLGTSRVLNFNHASGGTVNTTGGNLTLGTAGQLVGANRLTKAGTNSLILSANNTGFSGGVTLNGGIVQVNSAQALGTSGNLTFTGGTLQYTSSSAAGEDYSSRIKNSSSAIILDSNSQTISLAGIIDSSNVGGLTKTGAGTVTLANANAYTGNTTIQGGTLKVTNTSGLGATAVTLNTANTSVLQLLNDGAGNNGVITYGNALTVGFSGVTVNVGNNGANTGNTIELGALNMGSTAYQLNVTGANSYGLRFTGTTTFGILGAVFNPTANLELAGGATGNFAWSKLAGSLGTLTLSGTADNVNTTGLVTINSGGMLILNKTSSSTRAIGAGGISVIDNTVQYAATAGDDQINDAAPVTLANGANVATLDLNGISDTIGTLTFGGAAGAASSQGVVTTGAGTLTLAGGVTYTTTGNPLGATISGNLDLGSATRTFTIGDSSGATTELDIQAAIAGTSIGIVKTGAGVLQLAGGGVNTYTGLTDVQAGTLAYGGSDVTANAASLKVSGGTLSIGAFNDTVAGVQLISGTITGTSGVLTSTTAYDMQAGTASAILGGSVGLTKSTAGTVTLTGANTYTGATAVNAGTLLVNSPGALHASSVVTVASGATLGGNGTIAGTVNVSAGGNLSAGSAAGTIGTLTLSNNSSSALTLNGNNLAYDLNAAGTSSDLIAITGDLVRNGTNRVFLSLPSAGVAATASPLTLMSFNATTGAGSFVFANGLTTMGNASLAVSGTDVQLTVAAGGLNHSVWVGTTATWDTGTNWNRNSTPASAFVAGDFVTFDDTGTATNPITNTGTISPSLVTFNNTSKNYTVNATIGGTGTSLVKSGTGYVRLGGTNTYDGGTFINAGIVWVTANTNLGTAGTGITFNGPGALSFGDNAATNQTIDLGSRPITLSNTGQAGFYFNGANKNITISGAITGTGGIIYGRDQVVTYGGGSGFENLNLLSNSNTFTGAITFGVNATENIGVGSTITLNSLADSTNPITLNGGGGWTITLGSGATQNMSLPNRLVNLLNSSSTFTNSNATYTMTLGAVSTSTSGAKTLNIGASGQGITIAGNITNGSGSIGIAKTGAGTLTLSGSNNYSGSTTIASGGGTIVMRGDSAYSLNTTVQMTSAAGSGSALQVLNDAGLVNDSTINVGGLSFNNGNTSPNISLTIGNNGGATTGATVSFSSVNYLVNSTTAQQGPSSMTANNGYKYLFNNVSLAATPGVANWTAYLAPSASSAQVTVGDITQLAGNTTAGRNAIVRLGGTNANNAVTGIISDATDTGNANWRALAVTKADSGTWTLEGANTYSGTTTISGGILNLGSAENPGVSGPLGKSTAVGSIVMNGGTLQYSASNNADYSSRFSTAGSQTWNIDTNNQSVAFNAALQGASSVLNKLGAGTLTLSGVSTYTGTTTVKNGSLVLDAGSDRILVTNSVVLGDTGTTGKLVLGGTTASNQTLTGLTTTGLGGSVVGGNASNSTLTLNIAAASTNTFGGTLGGGGANENNLALTKTGAGTLTLTGSSFTYAGGTNVNAGTLLLSGAVDIPTTGTLQVNAGGNFSLADGTARATTAGGLGLASGANLTFDWNAGNLDQLTSTAAATTSGNIGIIINNTSPSGAGGTLISSASGGLTTANGTQYFLANNTNFTATLTTTDTAVSIGSQSAVTALTAAYWKRNQVTGATDTMAYSSGTSSNWSATVGGAATGVVPGGSAVNTVFISTGGNTVTLGANMNLGSITFNDSNAVTISGNNSITLNNTGTSVASSAGADAALTNFTTLSAIGVTSTANANNTIGANIILGAGQTWTIASAKTLTVSGTVSGANALTKAGAGILELSGTIAHSGATTVSAGTLSLTGSMNGGSAISTSGIGIVNQSAAGVISGASTFTQGSSGTSILAGNNTYSGLTTVSAGTLILSGSNSSAGGTTVSAGTLQLNSNSNGGLASGTVTFAPNVIVQAIGADRTISQGVSVSGGDNTGPTFSGDYSLAINGEMNAGMGSGGTRIITNDIVAGKTLTIGSYNRGSNNAYVKFQGSGTTIVNGNILLTAGPGGGVTKSGTGTLMLNGNSDGPTGSTISQGTVIARSANALGSSGSTTTLAVGAAMNYVATGNTTLNIGAFTITGGTGGTFATIGGSIGSSATGAKINASGLATVITNTDVKVNVYGVPGLTRPGTPDVTTTAYTLLTGTGASTLNTGVYSLGTVYNNTDFTVGNPYAPNNTTLLVDVTKRTALTGAFWKGGLSGNTTVWAASDGSANSNWATTSGGAVQALVPGSGADVTIDGSFATAPTFTTLGADVNIKTLSLTNSGGLGINADGFKLTITPASSSAGIAIASGVAASTIASNVGLGAAQTWTNNSANALTVSGVISGGGTNSLTTAGTGTTILSGVNTYTGATNVNAGTLNVSGAGRINTSASINVAAGGTLRYNSSTALSVAPTLAGNGLANRAVLGGSGSIGVSVTLDNVGDVLSPGNSPSIQSYTVGQSWAAFSYDWEVNDFSDVTGLTAGSDFDQIAITGGLSLTGAAANSYYLNVLSLTAGNVSGLVPNFSEINRSWTILTTTTGITDFNAAYWNVNDAGFTNADTGTWSIAQDGNNLVLNYTVIPEPRAALLGGLGMLLLLRRRR